MKAARYHGICDVRIDDVELPDLKPDEVLVRVAYAGVCGSDLHVFAKGMFGIVPPMTMGHEFSGVVEAVGAQVERFQTDDHVVGDPRLGCERCEWCDRGEFHLCAELAFVGEAMPGSYAERIILPEHRLVQVPTTLDLRVAALVEPMAVAVHALSLAEATGPASFGIIGAGPVGLLTLVAAKHRRQAFVRIADGVEGRRHLAGALGADDVVEDTESVDGRWADVTVEAAGKQAALASAVRWLKPGGTCLLVGIYEEPVAFDPTDAVVKEARLVGVSAYGRRDLEEAVRVLENQASTALGVISDVLPLKQAQTALERCRAGASNGKVLLKCGPPDEPGRT